MERTSTSAMISLTVCNQIKSFSALSFVLDLSPSHEMIRNDIDGDGLQPGSLLSRPEQFDGLVLSQFHPQTGRKNSISHSLVGLACVLAFTSV